MKYISLISTFSLFTCLNSGDPEFFSAWRTMNSSCLHLLRTPVHQSLVKLPAFWTEDPVSWFRLAEGQFAFRNIKDPVVRYYHVLSSLSQDAVRLVLHVSTRAPAPLPTKTFVLLFFLLTASPTTRRWSV
jgi:hypothetical protein